MVIELDLSAPLPLVFFTHVCLFTCQEIPSNCRSPEIPFFDDFHCALHQQLNGGTEALYCTLYGMTPGVSHQGNQETLL